MQKGGYIICNNVWLTLINRKLKKERKIFMFVRKFMSHVRYSKIMTTHLQTQTDIASTDFHNKPHV